MAKAYFNSAVSNTVIEIATGINEIHSLEAENINPTDMWLHIWDSAAADVTVGVTAPYASYLIPAGDGTLYGAMDKDFSCAVDVAKALSIAITNDPDGGAAPGTPCVVNINYRKVRR